MTNAYGLGRSLVALGTLLTLMLNPVQYLFRPSSGLSGIVTCDGIGGKLSLFCLIPAPHLVWAQVIACIVLVFVVIGWGPRFTAIPHWYVSFSFFASVRDGDGGDQMAAVITLLLLPLALTDPRRWHWQRAPARYSRFTPQVVAYLSLWMSQLQVAIVYFDSFIEKLKVPEWSDGTEIYYVLHNNFFGAPHYLSALLDPVVTSGLVVLITWSVLCVELLLGINILLPNWARRLVLMAALAFHVSIALFLGITSFAIIMMGALFVGLSPSGLRLEQILMVPRFLAGRGAKQPAADDRAKGLVAT